MTIQVQANNKDTCDSTFIIINTIAKAISINPSYATLGKTKLHDNAEYGKPFCIKSYGKNSNQVSELKAVINAFK
jgi:hypothetical protein